MKALRIKSLLLTFLALCTAAVAGERWRVLHAINLVENPTNHTHYGSKGELGPYQFRPQTWKLHTKMPFRLAVVREHADAIAVEHYNWICRGLVAAGIDPNPYNVAMAWNCGLNAVVSGRVPAVTYNYAQRVSNLVESFAEAPAVAASAAAAKQVAQSSATALVAKDIRGSSTPRFEVGGFSIPTASAVQLTVVNPAHELDVRFAVNSPDARRFDLKSQDVVQTAPMITAEQSIPVVKTARVPQAVAETVAVGIGRVAPVAVLNY